MPGRTAAIILGLLMAAVAAWSEPGSVSATAGNRQTVLAHPGFLVSAGELASELGSPHLLVIDVREPGPYRAGHIPGAVDMPLSELQHTVRLANGNLSPAIVKPAVEIAPPFRRAGIDANSRIVLYDNGQTYLATRVWWMLDYYGHRHLALLDGGLPAWEHAGGALSTAAVTPARGDFRPVPDPAKIASYAYVEAHIGTSATALCDALSASSYRTGAIPGSISLPWTRTIDTGAFGKLKGAGALASLLESLDLSKNREVVFYCERGYVSSLEYFVARALGYRHVRLYDGSISNFTAHGGRLEPSGGT